MASTTTSRVAPAHRRSRALVVVALALTLALGACGGDDDGGEAADEAPSDEPGAAPDDGGDAASVDDARTCLEDAGIEAVAEDPATDLDESRGVIDRLRLTIREPEPGVGTVVWYGSEEQAREADEEAALVAGEGRSHARIGVAVFSLTGAEETVTAVEGCLGT